MYVRLLTHEKSEKSKRMRMHASTAADCCCCHCVGACCWNGMNGIADWRSSP